MHETFSLIHTGRNVGCFTWTPNYLIETNDETYTTTINDIRCERGLESHSDKTLDHTNQVGVHYVAKLGQPKSVYVPQNA